nr:phosphatidylinositol 4-phosphate 5-kinase-like [Lytechinus pictus]
MNLKRMMMMILLTLWKVNGDDSDADYEGKGDEGIDDNNGVIAPIDGGNNDGNDNDNGDDGQDNDNGDNGQDNENSENNDGEDNDDSEENDVQDNGNSEDDDDEQDSEDLDDQDIYTAEKIIKTRVKGGKKEYFVKWRDQDFEQSKLDLFLTKKFEAMLERAVDRLAKKIEAVESLLGDSLEFERQRVNDLQVKQNHLETRIKNLEEEVAKNGAATNKSERFSRRNNIRLVGIDEYQQPTSLPAR